MPDILRVTTPLVNKTQIPDTRRSVEALPQFNLQDISRVAQTTADSGLLMQNNGLLAEEKASALLLDLLRDPSVAVAYLRNISLLQELFDLLPANNRVLTEEIQQMFSALILPPEDLKSEMSLQEGGSSQFRGELFDQLRSMLDTQAQAVRQALETADENAGTQIMRHSSLQKAVAGLLKSLSSYTTQREALGSVANNLEFLSNSLSASRQLSGELMSLSEKFRSRGAPALFEHLKKEVAVLLERVEESILYSPKLEKIVSLTTYNMSRFNDSYDSLESSLEKLLAFIPEGRERDITLDRLVSYLERPHDSEERSKVLTKLTEIINKQVENKELLLSNGDKLEKIVQSLLSSPSNFTPLLHYILPMQYRNAQSFMEMWINPNGEEDNPEAAAGFSENYHLFIVFDIEEMGRFNMELYVRDKNLELSLFCPPAYTEYFKASVAGIGRVVERCGYKFGEARIEALERERSLMDVFRSLPYKRTGVDVKV